MKSKILFVLVLILVMCHCSFAQVSRIVAVCDHSYSSVANDYTPTDSVSYYYTGTRGGDNEHWMKYTTDTSRSYLSGGGPYAIGYVSNQTFDASSNVLSNTTLTNMSGTYINATLSTNTFDAGNRLTRFHVQQWDAGAGNWRDNQDIRYVSDGSGRTECVYVSLWNATTSTLDPYNRDTTLLFGLPVNVSMNQNWNAATSTYDNWLLDSVFFDASGYITSSLEQQWVAGAWINKTVTKRIRNSSKQRIADSVFSWDISLSQWVNLDVTVYTPDANNNVLSQEYIYWTSGGWLRSNRLDKTYNSYNQEKTSRSLTWDATSNSYKPANADNLSYFYYEEIASGVPELKSDVLQLAIQPNPAGRLLELGVHCAAPQQMELVIYNAMGQLMYRHSEVAKAAYNTMIPVDQWPAGNYSVIINTPGGYVAKQFAVVH